MVVPSKLMAMAMRSSFVSCPLFPTSWFVGEGAYFIHFNSLTHYNSSVAPSSTHWKRRRRPSQISAALDALIFDCDGVILESEDLHRQAYNATFSYYDVRCPSSVSPVEWSTEFYDVLQNQIGGGKPKMRWYFNTNGWPSSSIFSAPPENEEDKSKLIDTLQDWKTSKYKDIIQSGAVLPRPGVLHLMDEAKRQGIKVAVCSAATKSSVVFVLNNLLGKDRFQQLDCFLAGDDVDKKKPDPTIYNVAAEKLAVTPKNCLVIEDSVIGLQAALGAGMNCVISFTSSTSEQDFQGAVAIFSDLGNVSFSELAKVVEATKTAV